MVAYPFLLRFEAIALTISFPLFLNIIIQCIIQNRWNNQTSPSYSFSVPWYPTFLLSLLFVPWKCCLNRQFILNTFALRFVSCSFISSQRYLFLVVSLSPHLSVISQQKKLYSVAEFHYSKLQRSENKSQRPRIWSPLLPFSPLMLTF